MAGTAGYDLLPVAAPDVISAAEYTIKQAACPVVMSGLEQLQNAGKEQMIDLIEARINVAEATMANLLAGGVYSDGTGTGGKQLTGLDAAVPVDPTTGTYGGIDRVHVDLLAVGVHADRCADLGQHPRLYEHDVGQPRARQPTVPT